MSVTVKQQLSIFVNGSTAQMRGCEKAFGQFLAGRLSWVSVELESRPNYGLVYQLPPDF